MPRVLTLFSTAERAGGAPVELYTFTRGVQVWRYTSADATQIVSGISYPPADITRAAIEQKQDTGGLQLTVTVPLALDLGQALLVQSPLRMIVTIQRLQPAGTPIKQTLAARMVSVKFSDDAAELTIATVEYGFKKQIPATIVQRTCPWALYAPPCGVDKSAFAHATTISSVAGQTITVATLADTSTGFYANGILIAPNGNPVFIVQQVGLVLTIWAPVPSDCVAAAAVTVYPGCDKQFATCETKFSNAENFGGYPNLPTLNPTVTGLW